MTSLQWPTCCRGQAKHIYQFSESQFLGFNPFPCSTCTIYIYIYILNLYTYIYIYIYMHSIYFIYLSFWIQRLPGSHDFHHQGAWDTAPANTSPAPDWRSPPWRRLRRRVADVDTPNRRSPRRARPPVIKNLLETGIFMGKSWKIHEEWGLYKLPCLITRG